MSTTNPLSPEEALNLINDMREKARYDAEVEAAIYRAYKQHLPKPDAVYIDVRRARIALNAKTAQERFEREAEAMKFLLDAAREEVFRRAEEEIAALEADEAGRK